MTATSLFAICANRGNVIWAMLNTGRHWRLGVSSEHVVTHRNPHGPWGFAWISTGLVGRLVIYHAEFIPVRWQKHVDQ